jgi:hypothetical protein
MAQYKKDDIKKKIDAAALRIFAEKGYAGSSISDIAKKAQVSVGNIYRYYKSKDDIFYSIIPADFSERLKNVLLSKISYARDAVSGRDMASGPFSLINEEFIGFIALNREIMLILFMGAGGTKFGAVKDEAIDYLIKTVKENYSGQDNEVIFDERNDYVVRSIYMKLIEMIMDILKVSDTLPEIKRSLNIINSYHLFGVTNLFK